MTPAAAAPGSLLPQPFGRSDVRHPDPQQRRRRHPQPARRSTWGWDRLKAAGDPYGRIKHLPKKQHGEMAFVQHMVASLAERGRLAVVLPNGCLFRGGAERDVRRELLRQDVIEAIVALPKDLFYGAGIPACWIVISRNKAAHRSDNVLFIDTSGYYERIDTKNALRDEDVERIVAAFLSPAELDGFSSTVTVADLLTDDCNLSVRRFVRGLDDEEEETPELEDALDDYWDAGQRREQAQHRLEAVIARIEQS